MKYDDRMDKQCIDLCNAINEIPFLITTESCCGHEKNTFNVWIRSKNLEGLYILSRSIDRRYGGPVTQIWEENPKEHLGGHIRYEQWRLLVEDSDSTMSPIFHLESSSIGKLAYSQARKIAKNIRYTLKHKECMKSWLAGFEEKRD